MVTDIYFGALHLWVVSIIFHATKINGALHRCLQGYLFDCYKYLGALHLNILWGFVLGLLLGAEHRLSL